MKAIQNSGLFDKGTFDAFNLSKKGTHREYSHDVASAFLSAYMISPDYAADLAMTHLMLDRAGNMIHDNVGAEEKDILESTINKFCATYRTEVLGIKPRKRVKMFF